MWTDPIVEELHRIREAHAARFGDDLHAIAGDLLRIEAEWPAPKIDPPPKSPTIHRVSRVFPRQPETPEFAGSGPSR